MVLECFNFFFEKVSNCPRFSKKQFSFDYNFFPKCNHKKFSPQYPHSRKREKKNLYLKKLH